MAIVSEHSLLAGVRGKVGAFVVKRYGDKVVLSAKPDMRNVKPSALQKKKRACFAEAVRYAKGILEDPKKRAACEKKVAKGQQVFHYAVKEFLLKKSSA